LRERAGRRRGKLARNLRRYIFWSQPGACIDATCNFIGRANLDGSDPVIFLQPNGGNANPQSLASDGTHLFWVSALSGQVGEVNLDGSDENDDLIPTSRGRDHMASR
jgi:hypothetical protein